MTSLAVQAQQETALTPLGAEMVGALGGEAQIAFGELTLVAPRERIVEVLTALRDQFGFQQLLDLCGVDYPDRKERFEVVYHLLSMTRNARLREREPVAELNPKLCEGRIAFGAAREAVDGLSKLLRLVPRIYGQANSNVKECA